jgi:hypothetical protein
MLFAASLLLAPLTASAILPLVTDDTSVQGQGRWQVEAGLQYIAGQGDAGAQRAWTPAAFYGLTDQTDAYISAPYKYGGNAGSGWGDTEAGLRWRFAQQGPLNLMLRSQLMLPTGDERRGLGAGHTGAGVLLVAQWDIGRFTLLGNAGFTYQPNKVGERRLLWQVSGAALYHATDKLQLLVDAVVSRNPMPGDGGHPAFVIAGFIYTPRPWVDLNVGYRYKLNAQAGSRTVMAGATIRW